MSATVVALAVPMDTQADESDTWAASASTIDDNEPQLQKRPANRESERSEYAKQGPAERHGFSDPEVTKQKVRDSVIQKDPYNVFDYYHEDGMWRWIATHPVFENTTLGVIALNAVYIAVDTDWNKPEPLTPTGTNSLQDADTFFVFMEHAFCVYFTGEWIVRFMAFKVKRNGLKDGWFVFDSLLVFMMVMETWVMLIIMAAMGGGGESPMGEVGILRLFRLLRLSRLLRMLKSLPELMILIKGMVTAMTSVCYVMGLLLILTYVFAIAFTQLAVGTECGDVYFANVGLSMYSLLIHATLLDDLAGFMNSLRNEMWTLLILAFIFIILAALTVMNMLVGVLCEVVSGVAATEKEEILTNTVAEKLSNIINDLDQDFDGQISYQEFSQILERPDALRALKTVGVNPEGLVDFAEYFFVEDGQPVQLSFDAFMEMALDLREENVATVKDILNLGKNIKLNTTSEAKRMKKKIDKLRDSMQQRTKELSDRIDETTNRFQEQAAVLLSEVRRIPV